MLDQHQSDDGAGEGKDLRGAFEVSQPPRVDRGDRTHGGPRENEAEEAAPEPSRKSGSGGCRLGFREVRPVDRGDDERVPDTHPGNVEQRRRDPEYAHAGKRECQCRSRPAGAQHDGRQHQRTAHVAAPAQAQLNREGRESGRGDAVAPGGDRLHGVVHFGGLARAGLREAWAAHTGDSPETPGRGRAESGAARPACACRPAASARASAGAGMRAARDPRAAPRVPGAHGVRHRTEINGIRKANGLAGCGLGVRARSLIAGRQSDKHSGGGVSDPVCGRDPCSDGRILSQVAWRGRADRRLRPVPPRGVGVGL